ncbi:hypothetical protein OEB99_09535 [Actinotalea sp. M2MS4P-6]|uniref:hypothetical protein n=1 Tax=Actinotalea sp. M2MS4P-6 TaxID=2983762 RepID=UPI0021E4DFF6|nr:hypothetical protein [Actinotalea sp. M2MS4P-6]MCV2394547.1 hypothetical protein [Actinotalea sp. M2MS4P-6]
MELGLDNPLGYLWLRARVRLDRARSTGDLGASAIEWVIITGVLVALAAAVGVIIYNLVRDRASEIAIPDAPGGGGSGGGGGNP